jgi:hypothetical protein
MCSVIPRSKDEGYNLKYNNKRIDSKWNQLYPDSKSYSNLYSQFKIKSSLYTFHQSLIV